MKLAVFILVLLLFAGASPTAAQPAPAGGQIIAWQTLNNKNEFSVALPSGSTGSTNDKEYLLGRGKARVTKRVLVFRNINGAVLITQIFEGNVREISEELVSRIVSERTPYKLVKSQDIDGVMVSRYEKGIDSLFSVQQFFLFKKRLYVVQAHALNEDSLVLRQYLRSVNIVAGSKPVMPNLLPGDNVRAATNPPPIALDAVPSGGDSAPLEGKPDRDVVFLYKPPPSFPSDARQNGAAGEVSLQVLFSASGTIGKIEVESGPHLLRANSIAAAQQILFVPAVKDGKPVSIWKKLSYSFSIH